MLIGKELAAFIEESGLSHGDIAKAAGVSKATIFRAAANANIQPLTFKAILNAIKAGGEGQMGGGQ